MSTALTTLTAKLAQRLDMGDGTGLVEILKATAFKGPATDAQLTALMVVANQYGLNPWCKEIYAFPDRQNGIVPVVGVDGWSRIINSNPQFDGMDFEMDADSCTCTIYRKDRSHPIRVTEYMDECKRDQGPWKSHPRRMLRHKAMIQCARLAFGFGGIYDQDEAERIVEGQVIDSAPLQSAPTIPAKPTYPDEQIEQNADTWAGLVEAGKATVEKIINMVSSKYTLTDEQRQKIAKACEPKTTAEKDQFIAEMEAEENANA